MRTKILAAAILALLLLPVSSHAHLYDYEYVGVPFDWFSGTTYTPANHVTISLLTDHPLSYGERGFAENQCSEMISFVMSDGYQTLNMADGYVAELQIFDGLKADGTPYGWWIWLADDPRNTRYTVYSENSPDGSYDVGIHGLDSAGNFNDGTWTVSVKCDPPPIPEPSTALLMAAGCAGMFGATWWRRKSAHR
ncbi:PEP-CTERM sorting domain-containing protein [Geomonas subterranea]|uniref:PEP-CTERM sorting domain-containing protein n=1 Tax=Geomonas subterranea TaxID=2847989 RepID=A0ABX8LP98_9BACT|nr:MULTISPECIES: PEP-CTERM sorting domain-containing protein [Geomonas]QXE92757.1 PEP-CTERM sorting domain-containing protein [Geomonas subterranea]QXM09139.1 PEP-CTERM sorting domain-containing protein [Geomonas subterranea]